MSFVDSSDFLGMDGPPGLFLVDEELDPEADTAVIDGSTSMLNSSLPLIHFNERSVSFILGTV